MEAILGARFRPRCKEAETGEERGRSQEKRGQREMHGRSGPGAWILEVTEICDWHPGAINGGPTVRQQV